MEKCYGKQEKRNPPSTVLPEKRRTQNVEVVEVDEIDLEEVKSRLERGESVFITRKQEQKSDINFIAYETAKEPWYLIRS